MAAGVAAGINYLEQDLELSLLAGAQAGSVAAGMAFVGAWAERRRMTRIARAAADLAVRLTADGTPEDEAAARLLALRGADRVELEQAARRAAGSPDSGRALGSSAGWPCSAPCCSRQLESRYARRAGHPRGAGAGPRAPGRPL
jgi:hypothetical protein